MNEIGGYFGLELRHGKEFHENAIKLNTGRNCLEYILRSNEYKKIYIPYYTCDVILEPIQKLGLPYEYYSIDKKLDPIINKIINDQEVFLYTNYFGLKDKTCIELSKKFDNLIIDNSQAFFSKPIDSIDTFYSPRKFFGVPDGGYLYSETRMNSNFEQDISLHRFEHLIGRIDGEVEIYYNYFKKNDASLEDQPIKLMSKITRRLLKSVDYKLSAKIRRDNFNFLHSELMKSNKLDLDYNLSMHSVPMVYPYLIENGNKIKEKLIKCNIFVATYWPNVINWVQKETNEYLFAKDLIPLPVDQRYGKVEMEKILGFILDS